MRCKSCNYALWNLAERTCPECGTGFKPSEFEFVPGTVVYGCPHCECAYVGAGERGHLDPAQFDCTQCGERISMDEMTLRIGDEFTDRQTRPGVMPWLERQHRGRLKAFFQTVGMAMVRPQNLIRGVPQDASVGEALVFGFGTTVVLLGTGLFLTIVPWVLGFQGPFSRLMGGGMGGGFGAWIMLIWSVAYTLFALLITLSLLIFWPMVIHATLRLTGGCRHGIDRTFQAFGYSAGANALSAIPCVGVWIGVIWWMVSAILMIRAGQRVSAVRAALSVLALPLLVGGIWLGLLGLSAYAQNQLATIAGVPGVGTYNASQQQTMIVNSGVLTSMWQTPARTLPTHVSELLLTNPTLVMPGSTGFTQPGTLTTPADVPIGKATLATFANMSRAQQLAEITTELNAVPPNVVAHRFGDFVFTYHGLTAGPGMGILNDPNLWIVVMLPDPDVNGPPAPTDTVQIGFGSQLITTTSYAQLTADLKKQNAHRATLGLRPLPDLATVTHTKPAVDKTAAP